MLHAWQVIRETRQRGQVSIVPMPYSPTWWDADTSKPSRLRQLAYQWRPLVSVIHDEEGMREFVVFGDKDGATKAFEEILGPVATPTH